MAARRKKKRTLAQEIAGVVLVSVAILLALSIYSNASGVVGGFVRRVCLGTLGLTAYAMPFALAVMGIYFVLYAKKKVQVGKVVCYTLIALSLLSVVHLIFTPRIAANGFIEFVRRSYELGVNMHQGAGAFAALFTYPILYLFGVWGAYIFYFAVMVICILISTNLSLRAVQKDASKKVQQMRTKRQEKVQQRQQRRQAEELMAMEEGSTHGGLRIFNMLEDEDEANPEDLPTGRRVADADDGLEFIPGFSRASELTARYAPWRETDDAYFADDDSAPRKSDTWDAPPEQNAYDGVSDGAADDVPWEELDPQAPPQAQDSPWETEDDLLDAEYVKPIPHDDSLSHAGERAYTSSMGVGSFGIERTSEDPECEQKIELPHRQPIGKSASTGIGATTATPSPAPPAPPQPAPKPYIIPPLTMLSKQGTQSGEDRRRLQLENNANAALLERTFDTFGISVKVTNVVSGPAITRFEVLPAPGVRVNRIANLSDDIALSLAASSVRIEAPIPGKNAVGIEVPNRTRISVMLRDVLSTDAYQHHKSKLAVGLGKDIAGREVVIDLAKMPHLLIAGTTGSGKSVCVNTLIASLLFRTTPEEVKLIMIDPKKVEFVPYNNIPQLVVPVVTEPKKAAGALHGAVEEMMRRYSLFAERGARDIGRYNDIMKMMDEPRLPYEVIFIDELADLMMVAAKEVEEAVCRIAQMGRAAGIHLVIATQRPSVDVVTGLIKANFPSRIALSVSSQTDSRTILDQGGAEKLLGNGDMLFHTPSTPKPIRIQGAFISDPEVQALTDFIKQEGQQPVYDESVLKEMDKALEQEQATQKAGARGGGEEEDDALLHQAIDIFLDAGQGSTSLLQRRLRIGYGRAARLLDEIADMGIIGPPDGPRPRKVLMTRAEYEQTFGRAEE